MSEHQPPTGGPEVEDSVVGPPATDAAADRPATAHDLLTVDTRGLERGVDAGAGVSDSLTVSVGDTEGYDTARTRLLISGSVLVALGLGLVGAVSAARGLQAPAILYVALVGVGSSAWALVRSMALPERLARSVIVGWAVWSLGGMAMGAVSRWEPTAVFAVVAIPVAVLHVLGVIRAARDLRSSSPFELPSSPALVAAAVIVVATATALIIAATHRGESFGILGFIPLVSWGWIVAVIAVVAACCVAIVADRRVAGLGVASLVTILTLSPALVYALPRAQSAEKHVDLIRQIWLQGAPFSSVEVYNSWSGFFASTAWIAHVAGIEDPTVLATYWPALLGILRVAVLAFLFLKVTSRIHVAWVAVLLAVLADTIGADYFSPQSMAFVIGLAVIAVAVGNSVSRVDIAVILVGSITLTVNHQLSPYIVAGVLVVLAIGRVVRPWWVPLLCIVPTVAWSLFHASAVSQFLDLKLLGRLTNFLPPVAATAPSLPRDPILGQAFLALAITLGLLGVLALVALIRRRRERAAWAFAIASGVGLVGVAVNPYGSEGIFRATLFAVPWLAALAATAFVRTTKPSHVSVDDDRISWTWTMPVAILMSSTFLVAAYGLDASSVTRQGDLDGIRWFQSQGGYTSSEPRYLLNLGQGIVPFSPATQGGGHFPIARADVDVDVVEEPPGGMPDLVNRLTTSYIDYVNSRGGAVGVFAIWSPASSWYDVVYGLQSQEQFAALRDALAVDPRWSVALRSDDSVVFELNPSQYRRAGG